MFKRNPIYSSRSDWIMDIVVWIITFIATLMTLYPVLYVISISFSSRDAVEMGKIWLYPIDFNTSAYRLLLTHSLLISSYLNTIFYTTVGTIYSLVLTVIGGYVLSKRNLIGRNLFTFLITFTMLFSGGLIPTFLVVNKLGMFNTRFAMIIPCAVSAWNMILVRTSMQSIPISLEESAKIDGANDIHILNKIYIPLSKPVIATIGLFYAVGKWNDFFTALIYLNNEKFYPVQLVIRGLLVSMTDNLLAITSQTSRVAEFTPMAFKGAVVVVTMMPIMLIYPFIQKYFVKGIMIGAVKG